MNPTLFHTGAIELGPSDAYINGLDRWLIEKNAETTHGQCQTRSKNCTSVRKRTDQAEGVWSLFSVGVNRQGWPSNKHAFVGHRIHPSQRTPGPSSLKLDATGWDEVNRGLMLPPLSFEGASISLRRTDSHQHRRPTHPNKPGSLSSRHQRCPSGLRNRRWRRWRPAPSARSQWELMV